MRKKALVLSIHEPCSEIWNEMEIDEQGRFCRKCEKIVVDFTSMSDQEISKIFEKANCNGNKICGRLKESQLNRPLEYREYNSQRYFALPVLLSGTMFIHSLNLNAADNPENGKSNIENSIAATDNKEYIVRGTIINDEGQPVPCATISYVEKSNSRNMVSVTDENGDFYFTTSNDEVFTLTIQHNDYKTEIVPYNSTIIQGSISITLQCKSPREWNTEYYVMEGRVMNEKGKPLVGATIKLLGTKRGANSRADGSFRIVKLQKGKYQIEVSYIGYRECKVEVVLDNTVNNNLVIKLLEKDPNDIKVFAGFISDGRREMVNQEDIGTVRRIKLQNY